MIDKLSMENNKDYSNLSKMVDLSKPRSIGELTITEKDIEDVLKDLDIPFIGEVSPGCYQIGKGIYTGKKGFEQFDNILKEYWSKNSASLMPKMVKLDGESMKLVAETLLQTKKK